jgi:hypothetical protein
MAQVLVRFFGFFGGLMAPVDDTNGVIRGPAVDKDGRVYDLHSETGQVFEGFALPMWPEVLALVERVVRLIPDAGYVGWDVGISSSGPVVIEGNTDPGTYVSLQRPVYTGLSKGLRDRVQDHL